MNKDLTDAQIEDNREYLKNLLGKTVSVMCTGLLIKGEVINFNEDEHAFTLTVDHSSNPVKWGEDTHTKTHPFMRKSDGWGSMKYVKEIL